MKPKRLSPKQAVIFLVAPAIALTMINASWRARGTRGLEAVSRASSAAPASSSSGQAPSPTERRQLVRVFVHGDDIYPGFITVRPGKVFLVAENNTQSDISLVVEKLNPGQPPQGVTRLVTRQSEKRKGQELTLGAGEYLFYAESNPAVRGKLIVDPRDR